MSSTLLEFAEATWRKRLMATHYSYRDSLLVAATPPLAAPGVYVFGANARTISTFNWPKEGDWPDARNTYAREVLIYATQNTWVQFISLNPRYLILATQQKPLVGIPPIIAEQPMFIPAGGTIRFNPTYGVSMVYWFNTVAGMMVVDIEGNVEGTE